MLQDNLKKFDKITRKQRETYERKNTDYGDSFNISLDKFGLIAFVVRAGDKMSRIESLVGKQALVGDESMKDTISDLANYCTMALMWLDNDKEEVDAIQKGQPHIPGGY